MITVIKDIAEKEKDIKASLSEYQHLEKYIDETNFQKGDLIFINHIMEVTGILWNIYNQSRVVYVIYRQNIDSQTFFQRQLGIH